MWNQLALAFSFLTLIRLPFSSRESARDEDLASSFTFFPLVGGFLGGFLTLWALALHTLMPSLVLAVFLTFLLALATRGLHLDGLADLADALGGGYTPQRRLSIMKDSHIGAFGAIALILFLFMKVAALQTLIVHSAWGAILLVPALSRLAMVLTAHRMPYARREGGLGRPFLQSMTRAHVLGACLLCGLWCLIVSLPFTLWLTPALVVCVILVRQLALKTLQGVTGDVLGAANEITETFLLMLAAAIC